MQLRRVRRFPAVVINIAPLIDVVFLLIIFFMTVSQISRVEAENIALPEASEGNAASLAPGRLVVNVSKEGRVVIAGLEYTPETLQTLVAEELADHADSELNVVIRGDRDAPWQHVAHVIRGCAKQGIVRIRMAVSEGEPDL